MLAVSEPRAPDAATPPAAPAVGIIARQAIVDGQGRVAGHELFHRLPRPAGANAPTDALWMLAATSWLPVDAQPDGAFLLLSCTHEALAAQASHAAQSADWRAPAPIVLAVPPLAPAVAAEVALRQPLLALLRQRGYRLAFDHTVLESVYAPWLPLADIIVFDWPVLTPERARMLMGFAQRRSPAQRLVRGLQHPAERDSAQQWGAHLFQGYPLAPPAALATRLLAPAQAHTLQLIALLQQQADIAPIEALFKRDAALGVSLLRLLNTAGLGRGQPVQSFRQAVMLLGHQPLARWALLLLATRPAAGVPPAVGHAAVVRGRLMELLAPHMRPAVPADSAFLAGLLSLLGAMLGMPLAQALALLNLPEAVTAALLQRHGALGALLALAENCETPLPADCPLPAPPVPGVGSLAWSPEFLNQSHLQALAWASHLADGRRTDR